MPATNFEDPFFVRNFEVRFLFLELQYYDEEVYPCLTVPTSLLPRGSSLKSPIAYFFVAPKAWTLSLLGRCHLVAGEAVTAEGLFRAALDGLPGVAEEADDIAKSQRSAGVVAPPVLFASPLHPFSKAAMLRGYSELLMQWEKREAEGEVTARQAETVSERTTALASLCYFDACLVRESCDLIQTNRLF